MPLDQRSTAILTHLVKAKTFVPIREITEKFQISRRTIYYDMDKVNDWLKENYLPEVKYVRSAGFILEEEAAVHVPEKLSSMNSWHYEYSLKERKAWLAIYLIARDIPLYLEGLMEKVRVSRNTTIDDLKGLKQELERFHLSLEFNRKSGYVIKGKEEDKRKAIVHFLQHVLFDQNSPSVLAKIPLVLHKGASHFDLFDYKKMEAVQQILGESEQELNLQYTDEFLFSLAVRLLLFCRRVSDGKKIAIDRFEKEVLQETKQYRAAQKIGEKLSRLFTIEFPEDEIFYITKHLLSSRVQFSEEPPLIHLQDDAYILAKVVTNMVTDFQRYACVFFENRQEIEKNLLLHVKPAYYRITYGLEFESDMTESIKGKYQDIFLLTSKTITHLEAVVEKKVNEHEIALIAMHFGGWMQKAGAKPADRKRALLVCTNGVGTSRLLLHQLEGLFSTVDLIGSVSLREYEKNHYYDVDFILSTIPLEGKEHPVFVVSPILTEAEKESLLKKVIGISATESKSSGSIDALMEIIRKHATVLDQEGLQQDLKQYLSKPEKVGMEVRKPSLKEILPVGSIQLKSEVSGWEEAIRKAAAPLLAAGSITESYIQAMIDNIVKMGPYVVIAPQVAIPHARPEDGVNRLSMSLLKLTKGVSFSEMAQQDIHLVIVLAAVDGEAHLTALSQLTDLLSDEGRFTKLIEAETAAEMFEIIRTDA
ncbi:BglG family transcription antiterminator [Neobacillus jeddahensis]|uniref:BglG family transcription antiterminator n=1 Tax=Neobacillus jeddahensis TaxID=1461580 RepID=UPI00058D4608|nr:BglG family transcription antiterminator [Neobacillus jeddahensis]